MKKQKLTIEKVEPVAVYKDRVYTWSVKTKFSDGMTMWLFNFSKDFDKSDVGSSVAVYIRTESFEVIEKRHKKEELSKTENEWGYLIEGEVYMKSKANFSAVGDGNARNYIIIKSNNKYINAIEMKESQFGQIDEGDRIRIESFRTDITK